MHTHKHTNIDAIDKKIKKPMPRPVMFLLYRALDLIVLRTLHAAPCISVAMTAAVT